jgi:hypothetical protein
VALAETADMLARLALKNDFSPVAKQIQRDTASMGKAIDQTASRSYRAGQQIGTGIKRGALLLAGGLTIAAGAGAALLKTSISAASDLSETVSKVGVVFGKSKDQVLAFGKAAAAGIGLSTQAADEAAATFGNLLVSMGLAQSKSATMSVALVKLAGDLASFNNINPEDALIALRAGLVGESEPLRKLGVNLNEQVLKAEAVRLGLVKLTKGQKEYTAVLPPAIKAQAAYSLIFKQSKTAQGDFQRTQEGLANQTRILKANWENLKATVGTAALPSVAKVFQRINAEFAKPATIAAIQKLGEAFADLLSEKNIEQGAKVLGGLFDTAVAAAPILQAAAQQTLNIVKTAVGVFTSLPPEVQALAAGAFALNKITGGLVTNIAGGLIDLIGKSRGSNPGNPVWVAQVGGPGVGPPVPSNPAGIVVPSIGAAVPVGLVLDSIHTVNTNLKTILAEKAGGGALGPSTSITGGLGGIARSAAAMLNYQLGHLPLGKIKDDLNIVHDLLAGYNAEFKGALQDLRRARTDAEIKKAAAAATGLVEKGRGNVAGTQAILAGLRKALHETHDPKLQAALKADIALVERKLPARQFAAQQLAKADKILKSNESNKQKIADLTGVARALKDRGLPHAAATINSKIDAAKKAEVGAVNAAKAGISGVINSKNFSPTIILPKPTITIRELANSTRVVTNYGGVHFSGTSVSKP